MIRSNKELNHKHENKRKNKNQINKKPSIMTVTPWDHRLTFVIRISESTDTETHVTRLTDMFMIWRTMVAVIRRVVAIIWADLLFLRSVQLGCAVLCSHRLSLIAVGVSSEAARAGVINVNQVSDSLFDMRGGYWHHLLGANHPGKCSVLPYFHLLGKVLMEDSFQ